jgi:ADP-ribosyl-[dinitrogen reductase] hydrolase
MDKIATRTTWKNEPMVNPKRIDLSLQFTDEQFSKLTNGLIPHEMEDKWFIFYENDWLFFHRSWTGFGIFKAQLIKEQEGYAIKEFWAERNEVIYSNRDDDSDAESLVFLIAEGLLRVDVREIYVHNNIKSEVDFIKGWSNFGSLLFPNQITDASNSIVDYTDQIKSVLLGVAVGDAIGVPVEFKSREYLRKNPVLEMFGNGTHKVPAGTFSDDSSLTFCLAEALTQDFDLNTIGQNFVKWYNDKYWTARGEVFDIGNTTLQAIYRLEGGIRPDLAGGIDGDLNGNGSLMRILPLLFYLLDKKSHERFEITKQISSITHRHIRSVIACYYYLEFARQLFEKKDKFEIYEDLKKEISDDFVFFLDDQSEVDVFNRLLKGNIYELPEEKIHSSGYVVHTLEASIWCLLTTDNYKDAVLKAVNLGEDTDTTGAVTGGLAGLLYGVEAIPKEWIDKLARKDDIEDLAERIGKRISNQ